MAFMTHFHALIHFTRALKGTLISLCIATQTTSTTSQRVLLASLGQTRVVASGAHDASLRLTRGAANTHIDVILAAIVAIAFTHGVERRASDATRDAVHLTQLSLGLRRRDVLGEAPGAHQRYARECHSELYDCRPRLSANRAVRGGRAARIVLCRFRVAARIRRVSTRTGRGARA